MGYRIIVIWYWRRKVEEEESENEDEEERRMIVRRGERERENERIKRMWKRKKRMMRQKMRRRQRRRKKWVGKKIEKTSDYWPYAKPTFWTMSTLSAGEGRESIVLCLHYQWMPRKIIYSFIYYYHFRRSWCRMQIGDDDV